MNYYNENNPQAAVWLRENMKAGLIAEGIVDERSIVEVQPEDLEGFTQCHFFAGIGGWSYALRLAGWPDDKPCWTGSCPCQPFSEIGKKKHFKDPRHLWPELHRLWKKGRPSVGFGEQVASAAGRRWLSRVRIDVEALDYAVGAADLCAASVGAPHRRQRLYWCAVELGNSPKFRRDSLRNNKSSAIRNQRPTRTPSSHCWLGFTNGEGPQRHSRNVPVGKESRWIEAVQNGSALTTGFWDPFQIVQCKDGKARRIEPRTFPLANGFPGRVHLLRGYGNAIVPQVAAEFVKAFQEILHA